jgi:hypothetical protein
MARVRRYDAAMRVVRESALEVVLVDYSGNAFDTKLWWKCGLLLLAPALALLVAGIVMDHSTVRTVGYVATAFVPELLMFIPARTSWRFDRGAVTVTRRPFPYVFAERTKQPLTELEIAIAPNPRYLKLRRRGGGSLRPCKFKTPEDATRVLGRIAGMQSQPDASVS